MHNCPGKFVLIFLIDLVLIIILCFNVWTLWKTLLNHLNFNDVEVDCTWAPWKSWSICTKSCGGGTRTKNRTKLVIEAYGGTCLGNQTETQVCNEKKCPGTNTAYFYIRIVLITLKFFLTEFSNKYLLYCLVDCVWGAYGQWTDCSADCGTGTQTRTRSEATTAAHGGTDCVGDATETRDCNTHHCPGT